MHGLTAALRWRARAPPCHASLSSPSLLARRRDLDDGFGCAKMCLTYINCGGTNPLDRVQGADVFSMSVGLKYDQFIYLCNLFCSTMGTQGNRSYTASTNIDIDDEDSKISCLLVGHLEARAGGTTVGQREL